MAGASMNDIKSRMKSVKSTMQITQAMELVATSKLRRAKERVERARPYYEMLHESISDIATSLDDGTTPWFKERDGRTLFVVIAGDRGLAGGYNANVFRMTQMLAKDKDAIYLPIGKKANEYYKHRALELLSDKYYYVQDIDVGQSISVANDICEGYLSGRFSKVILIFTKFVSMISQLPVYEELLPFSFDKKETPQAQLIEQEPEDILKSLVPSYLSGIIYSAVSESCASESGARRSAMNAANKNAEEMINTLMLKYNRARQAVITQEITEIVSGAEAL